MKFLIIGSGLIGLSTALFLSKSGHKITIIDKNKSFGLGASFANGSQISASYSQPWSSFDNLLKMISWLGKPTSPILFKPTFSYHQTSWALGFLKECLPFKNEKNIKDMLRLSLYSRETFSILDNNFSFNYHKQNNGIITFYQNKKSFNEAKKSADIMRKFGLQREILTNEQTIDLEPVFKNKGFNLYGSDYTKDDFSGDAFLWMENVFKICKEQLNVEFLFNKSVVDFIQNKSGIITNIAIQENNNTSFIGGFDGVILCSGTETYFLQKLLKIKSKIYPVKGYSATLELDEQNHNNINKISLTDSENKIVFSNLGGKLRVAGTAEFNDFDYSLNIERCDFLKQKAIEYFGDIFTKTSYWTGLRPTISSGVPYIGKTHIKNLFINSGHGTLGWTMAAGSGRIISQIINNKEVFGEYLW